MTKRTPKPKTAPTAPLPADVSPTSPPGANTPGAKTPRANTKLAGMIDKLREPQGATIADLAAFTGWQEHSIRGVLAGAFKRRFGLTIVSEKMERGRVYRLAEPRA